MRFRKLTSIAMIFVFLCSFLPPLPASAAAAAVTKIRVSRQYDQDDNFVKMIISVDGSNLDTVTNIAWIDTFGARHSLQPVGRYPDNLYFEVLPQQSGDVVLNDDTFTGIHLGSQDYIFPTMPKLANSQTRTFTITRDNDDLILNGSRLNEDFKTYIDSENGNTPVALSNVSSITATISKDKFSDTPLGMHSLWFSRDVNSDGVDYALDSVYTDQFRLITKTPVAGLEMISTIALKGGSVYFQADEPLENYSVFFVNTTDHRLNPYSNAIKGINMLPGIGAPNKYLLTVSLPSGVDIGEYKVIFTNKVDDTGEPIYKITNEYTLDKTLTVIASGKKLSVTKLEDSQGPYTGTQADDPAVKLYGQYIGTLNIDNLKVDTASGPAIAVVDDGKTLKLTYNGISYNGRTIGAVVKTIKVFVGGQARFRNTEVAPAITCSENQDVLNIEIPTVAPDISPAQQPAKVQTVTEIYDPDGNLLYTLYETFEKPDAYTFLTGITPVISSISPNMIQLEKKADGNYHPAVDGLEMMIKGSNFYVSRFQKEDGSYVTKYPLVQINLLHEDGSIQPVSLQTQVYNDSGKLVDGTQGNDLGTRLLFTIPNDCIVSNFNQSPLFVPFSVTNPIPRTATYGMPTAAPDNLLAFVGDLPPNEVPVITSVTPDVVKMAGGDKVTVRGQNFQSGLKVFLDGKEVAITAPALDSKGNDWFFTFTAPPAEGGEHQLLLMNPSGGMAQYTLSYILAYVQPKITDFAPKVGTQDTVVVVKGDNFIPPKPAASLLPTEVYKLTGTRVLLGDRDINDYNRDSDGKPALQDCPTDTPVFTAISGASNAVETADYYQDVALEEYTDGAPDGTGSYYTIAVDATGNPSLIGANGINYQVQYDANAPQKLVAKVGNQTYNVVQGESGGVPVISLQRASDGQTVLNLRLKTIYTIGANGEITGHRVKIAGKNELVFTVPDLGETGIYDLTVVNPDTSKDSRTGTSGFTFYKNADPKPVVEEISPNAGDIKGGYYVGITGSGFQDGCQVYVDGNLVKAAETIVENSGQIWFKAPKYADSLPAGVSRVTVPVVVVNPNGAGGSKEDGFTYLNPDSRPVGVTAMPLQGSAAGGTLVEIKGSNLFPNGQAPSVFFNNIKAEVTFFDAASGYLTVKSPPLPAGPASLYVINSDNGVSAPLTFTAVSSNPVITGITPDKGTKAGRERVEITGTGFANGAEVRFGDISNRGIPRGEDNSGFIDGSGQATVNLPGGLTVSVSGYDTDPQITVKVTEGGKVYQGSFAYDPADSPYKNLSDILTGYPGYEKIRLEIKDRMLTVERGYSPEIIYGSKELLSVFTPSYYTTGPVTVTLINPDGDEAQGQFEYTNPVSKPVITNITKEGRDPVKVDDNTYVLELSYLGGNTVSIVGSGFEKNAVIQIPGILEVKPESIDYGLAPAKLTFTMPEVSKDAVDKLYEVIVVNEDGAKAYSKPIYIKFIEGDRAPVIEKLSPDKDQYTGGKQIKVEGSYFSRGTDGKLPSVFFGSTAGTGVVLVDSRTILVTAPPHEAGQVDVRVENPDGTMSNPLKFTYVSGPSITKVVDAKDPAENTPVKYISIDGGQTIKIKGTGFMEGARVVFNPVIKEASDASASGSDVIYIAGQPYILESGTDGTDVKIIDDQTLTVVTPAGKLKDKGVIVINPDGGATDVSGVPEYSLPQPETPVGVTAELVDDRFIRVSWQAVKDATQYEVYVVIDDGQPEFIGSIKTNGYVYSDLEERTDYQFIIKAVGNFTASQPSLASNTVSTGSRIKPSYDDGKLDESTSITRAGDTANVLIGKDDYGDKKITIDLTKGSLGGSKQVVVSLPAYVVASSRAQNIEILGSDFRLVFNPQAFNTGKVTDNRSRGDAGVRFMVSPASGNVSTQGGNYLSKAYQLDADFFLGKSTTKLDYLSSGISLSLDYDPAKAQLRRYKGVQLSRFDQDTGQWQAVAAKTVDSLDNSVTGSIWRLGTYMINGSR